ncbi:mesoderm development candidate 1-like [Elysia marginata]|uniref:Mesoderm development candidate 1-like n=1 Tax=Elysia marginata TaxID=1093978 RepID=A0AAV4FIK9_9GAST|nr:mesoderm development candidate 1-like [Elysia marginata]
MSGNNSGSSSSGGGGGDGSSRNTTLIFEECHTRVQAVAELLFISCTPRPVFTAAVDLALTHGTFEGYRDRVIGQLNKMLLLSRDVATQAHSRQIHWKQLSQRVKELTLVVVSLLELSAHISYLMAVRCGEGQSGAKLAVQGPVESVHRLTQADLDIRFSCQRLKRSRVNDLQPHLLVELCTALTKSLSVMTEVCRHAAEHVSDSYDQMFRAVRDLVHASSSSKRNQDRLSLCVESLTRSSSQLRDMLVSHSFVPSPSLPLNSSSPQRDLSQSHSSSRTSPLSMPEKDEGLSSLASMSCSSWERFEDKTKQQTANIHAGEKDSPAMSLLEGKQQKQGRLSLSPQGSPKLSPKDSQHACGKQSQLKTSSKSSKKDKDGSRSPRTKEKRHKSSSSSNTSSTSSSSHHHHHHHHHSQNLEKDSSVNEKCTPDKGNNQYIGEDNFGAEVLSPVQQTQTPIGHGQDLDEFFFSQTESAASLLSSSSSPQQPGSRPTSMEVEVVLASLAPDSPDSHPSADAAVDNDTLAGIRELHIDGAGLGEIPEGFEEDQSSRL